MDRNTPGPLLKNMVVITVGGPPGSGTSTLCRALQERTSLRYVYAGQIFRDMAKERGLSLMDLSRISASDPSIDNDLDSKMMIEAKKGNAILEGRMIGPLCSREGVPSVRIYVDADPKVRAARVHGRDGGEFSEVLKNMFEREQLERERYKEFYNIDPADPIWYDLVLDSTSMDPEQVLGAVLDKLFL